MFYQEFEALRVQHAAREIIDYLSKVSIIDYNTHAAVVATQKPIDKRIKNKYTSLRKFCANMRV